jgi:hypothetical protein
MTDKFPTRALPLQEATVISSGRTCVSFLDGFITPSSTTTSLAGLFYSTPFSFPSLPQRDMMLSLEAQCWHADAGCLGTHYPSEL